MIRHSFYIRIATILLCLLPITGRLLAAHVLDSSSLSEKAVYLQQDLLEKHWLNGLYVSIVPAGPAGTNFQHTVNQPGNVIHAGVWTGRYLAGVGYQFAASHDRRAREIGDQILQGLRIEQEVTGKPGLLARGYVRGHGPVEDYERDGRDSLKWHQGQGKYADYRWYGDVSVDNFNAVLYGYAVYYDLAASDAQRKFIARDVDRLMTHLLDNDCRIVDVDGKVTQWGHVGIDPDPSRDEYYRTVYARYLDESERQDQQWKPPLRASLMLLPDLLIAYHITGKQRYMELYGKVVARFKQNPDPRRKSGPFSLERLARVNHSSEGQDYEALYNLIRYEHDPELLKLYRSWVDDLWEMNWMEGNSLFTWMTVALVPEYQSPAKPGRRAAPVDGITHGTESERLALETLHLYPLDRVMHPVMNSLRADVEKNPFSRGESLSAKPIPINLRPLDNEYAWKGNPYQMDGWLKPSVTMFQSTCDDPLVEWFCDTSGKIYMTLDGEKTWRDMSSALRGANVQNISASTNRTFILHAQTDQGIFITRDGGMSWRPAGVAETTSFPSQSFQDWHRMKSGVWLRVDAGSLLLSRDAGKTAVPCMEGWRIPRANSFFETAMGIIASGPGGTYRSVDGKSWKEIHLWREDETGPADFLHAYWMGRYYGFIGPRE
ncbi:MAG: two component regulator propeller domain protein [Verrucomicrobiales bacterium]|nr:two component regulator propeller domain protein [Verrucomicrobiales bacterium]